MRFKHFLGEATLQQQIPLDKLENLLLDGGIPGAVTAIDHLSAVFSSLKGSSEKAVNKAVKWDGPLSIICGKDPTTRAFFVAANKGYSGRPRVCYTVMDVKERYHGIEEEILTYCLKYLPSLGLKGIVGGEVIFIKPDVQRTPDKMLKFKGTSKTYVVALGSETGQEIYRSKMGVAFTDHYTGTSIGSLTKSPGVPFTVKSNRNVWVQTPTTHDLTGSVNFTAEETREFGEALAKMVSDYKGLSKYFVEQARAMSLFHAIKTYGSTHPGGGGVDAFITGFHAFVKQRYVGQIKDKNQGDIEKKAIAMTNFIKRNLTEIRKTLEFYFLAAKLGKLAQAKMHNIKTVHGQATGAAVGMVAVQGQNNIIQLVDRVGV